MLRSIVKTFGQLFGVHYAREYKSGGCWCVETQNLYQRRHEAYEEVASSSSLTIKARDQ